MNSVIIHSSRFGALVVVWSIFGRETKIERIFLSSPKQSAIFASSIIFPDSENKSCQMIDDICAKILDILAGRIIRIPLSCTRFDRCSAFQQKVLLAQYTVEYGKISTYKQIADCIGNKASARAVGNALAKNPFPLIVPCHRTLRSDGSIGSYQGGIEMKRALLENEGIKL